MVAEGEKMKTEKINIQTTNFKSRFVPNQTLEQSFERAAKANDRFFLKAVNTIINDGKDDVVELKRRPPKYIDLYVNNEMVEEGNTYFNFYVHVCAELLKHYAEKISGKSMSGAQYKDLSSQEQKLISENVDLIRMFSEKVESFPNYVENIQKMLSEIKQKIDNNTKKELEELKNSIFKK